MPNPDDIARNATGDHADRKVAVIGAGPAGLTAAYQLSKAGVATTCSRPTTVVGGISRTVERDGWRFDIGGHRFFTKVPQVEALWHEILPDEDFLMRPRMSRIFYEGKYYDYPLKASNALRNLGVLEAVRCVLSYGWARVRPAEGPDAPRGLDLVALRQPPLPPLLQELQREGLGRARPARSPPTGRRSASRTSRCSRPSSTRCCRSGTRRRSPPSSRSSSTRSTGPG
jgi:hypothetical protein